MQLITGTRQVLRRGLEKSLPLSLATACLVCSRSISTCNQAGPSYSTYTSCKTRIAIRRVAQRRTFIATSRRSLPDDTEKYNVWVSAEEEDLEKLIETAGRKVDDYQEALKQVWPFLNIAHSF
jgi:hypothetical protein